MNKRFVKSLTIIMLIINSLSAAFYVANINKYINLTCVIAWSISDLWLILFVYSNCEHKNKKRKR